MGPTLVPASLDTSRTLTPAKILIVIPKWLNEYQVRFLSSLHSLRLTPIPSISAFQWFAHLCPLNFAVPFTDEKTRSSLPVNSCLSSYAVSILSMSSQVKKTNYEFRETLQLNVLSFPLVIMVVTNPLFLRVTERAKIVCNYFVSHALFERSAPIHVTT